MSEPAETAEFPIDALLRWYGRHRRELPFRPTAARPANAYHVLVSESMAQQTQIATVVPYFERFVAAFPTVEALAAAPQQAVLKLWQGLGYYRRARNLHAAAQQIVERCNGRVPQTVEALLELPGVGRYTAGAVASVAYGVPAPIVDGNVARVLARYFLIEEAVDRPAVQRQVWRRAGELVQRSGQPADFNQAVMELGALVCTPRSPGCLVCPLRESCGALRQGSTESLPKKTPKRPPTAVVHRVLALRRGERYLFVQRPATGLWAGMWELTGQEQATENRKPQKTGGSKPPAKTTPLGPASPQPRTAEDDPPDWPGWARQQFGLTIGPVSGLGSFTHATTHRAIRFEISCAQVVGGRLRPGRGVWRRLDRLDDLPLAKPQLRALEMLRPPASVDAGQ